MNKTLNILIDLSILKNVNCGLGQVALNYGYFFRDNYLPKDNEQIYLLVPANFVGKFGDKVKYIACKKIYRIFPFLMFKHFDVWHAIHQLSRYQPFAKKYILTIHDFNFVYEKLGRKVTKYLKKIQKKVNRADQIVCISNFAKEETEKFMQLAGKSISVVYNGIERIDLQPQTKPQTTICEPFFFSIGEVKEKKNFHVILNMMAQMPQYHYYLAGKDSTPYADKIRNMIKEKSLNNVHLLGIISQEEKVWLYRHCTAFLFPSLFEGFGLPVVEAMLFRKPVVSSSYTSLKEIGDSYVHFFPDDFNADKSVEIILNACEQTTNTQLDKAFSYALSFDWRKNLECYLDFYRNCSEEPL